MTARTNSFTVTWLVTIMLAVSPALSDHPGQPCRDDYDCAYGQQECIKHFDECEAKACFCKTDYGGKFNEHCGQELDLTGRCVDRGYYQSCPGQSVCDHDLDECIPRITAGSNCTSDSGSTPCTYGASCASNVCTCNGNYRLLDGRCLEQFSGDFGDACTLDSCKVGHNCSQDSPSTCQCDNSTYTRLTYKEDGEDVTRCVHDQATKDVAVGGACRLRVTSNFAKICGSGLTCSKCLAADLPTCITPQGGAARLVTTTLAVSPDIDDCNPANPCVHGTCADLVDDYVCTCEAGWTGKDCDQKTAALSPQLGDQCQDDYDCAYSQYECIKRFEECETKACFCKPDYGGRFSTDCRKDLDLTDRCIGRANSVRCPDESDCDYELDKCIPRIRAGSSCTLSGTRCVSNADCSGTGTSGTCTCQIPLTMENGRCVSVRADFGDACSSISCDSKYTCRGTPLTCQCLNSNYTKLTYRDEGEDVTRCVHVQATKVVAVGGACRMGDTSNFGKICGPGLTCSRCVDEDAPTCITPTGGADGVKAGFFILTAVLLLPKLM